MICARKDFVHDDGYRTVIDPARGVGLVVGPDVPKAPGWPVVFLFMRIDKAETVQLAVMYGKN